MRQIRVIATVISLVAAPVVGVMGVGGSLAMWIMDDKITTGRIAGFAFGCAAFAWWIGGMWFRTGVISKMIGTSVPETNKR